MPRVQFGLSSYERGRGGLPALPVINMFADEAPTEELGICLQSRPGLDDRGATLGSGPVQGLFRHDGVLDGQLFGVSDGTFYSAGVSFGALPGDGPVSWGGFSDKLFLTAGERLYQFNGTLLWKVPFPDNANTTAVVTGASRAIAIREDTQTFYWSNSLTSDIGGLNFATAESSPDKLRDLLFIDDTVILFGARTIEFWPNTGDNDLPFQPLEGRVIERGVRNTGACCHIGGSFAWVTHEHQVCVSSEDNVISNTGLQARIEASTECRLFRFVLEGNEFLALRLDNETQIYSRRSGLWSEFQTYGQDNWIAQCWADGVFGSAINGKTLEWGADFTDEGATGGQLERRFRAGFPINTGGVVLGNVGIRTSPGQTPYLTGAYADPQVEMRLSRDGAVTWGTPKMRDLGEQGKYRENVQWRSCGMASRPGFIAEYRCTDPVDFRISDVYVNEGYGGR